MTSNAGSENKESVLGFAKSQYNAGKEKALKALSDFLRPEFLGRLDDIIVFRALEKEDLTKIAKLMLDEYIEPMLEKGISFSYDNKLCEYLAEHADNQKSGARELRKLIQKEVEDRIAKAIVESEDFAVEKVYAGVEENEVLIQTI